MARFDFYANPEGSGFLLDVQANLMSELNTRIVVPLMPRAAAPRPAGRLNPIFQIEGKAFVMATQFLAAISRSELKEKAGSLAHRDVEIGGALDMLFVGF
ncbi:MAG TPA: CcdB family protein [Stellaceae bacterium]|jgi:toxin CcdB|nr:CcdB family protein [Stellaceae bacterium]